MEYRKGSVVYVETGAIFKEYKKYKIVARITEDYMSYYGHITEKTTGYLAVEEGGDKVKFVRPDKIMGEV